MTSVITGTGAPKQETRALGRPPAGRARHGRAAFWLLSLVFTVTMLGTTLPTPLYVVYQARWHFSAAMATVIFALYAVTVLATVLLAGRSSDQAGRKPVLAVALGAAALSTLAFIVAPDVWVLLAGRILSGLAAGLMTGTATAMLTELSPASAGRRPSLAATAANMGGLGLGPLFAIGTVTQVVLSRFGSRAAVLVGLVLFLAALGLILAALADASMPPFLAGTAVGGVSVGAIFLGSLATANRLAPPGRRGQVVSTFFVACYAGLVIPVVGVGVATEFITTFPAVLAFSLLLAAACVFSLARIATALSGDEA